jgi:CRISPR-associated protein Csd1
MKPVPFLGCDTAAYVLGKGKAGEKPEKTKEKQALFADLVKEFQASSGDSTAQVFLEWADRGKPGLEQELGSLDGTALRRIDMDPIAIRVEQRARSLHESSAAKAYWAQKARGEKASSDAALCLVCGQIRPTVGTLPQSLIGHQVPGATQANVALASVNFPSASRGASGLGLRSAPICADCAARAVQNLNYLAGSNDHSWRSPSGNLGMVWWATDPEAYFVTAGIFDARPELVARLLSAPQSGGDSKVWHPGQEDKFFALSFSGNVSRFVVRRWIELPLGHLYDNVVSWLRDVESPDAGRPRFPLFRYAECLGPMRREHRNWVTPAPEGSVEALVMAALARDTVPRHFLQLAISRASAEVRLLTADDKLTAGLARARMSARVGLLRLILNRATLREAPMPAHLDETRRDAAYVNGRLFAVRESLQRWALGDVNASIVDKFYERASTNPASVATALDVLSKQHLNALKRKHGMGAFTTMDRRITELNDLQSDAPGRLRAEEQAAWLAGYYQQRQHDFERWGARPATQDTDRSTDF